MLCKLSTSLPSGDGWLYEPKWDGFRTLVFADRAAKSPVVMQSRDLKPLERYFPELVRAMQEALREDVVLDGEIVIANPKRRALDFESLLLRIHPAASRIALLAQETPASFVAWDLLARGGDDLRGRPQAERRKLLEEVLAGVQPPLYLTPVTRDRALAEEWFTRFEGAGLDGVISKREDQTYAPGQRVMIKTKHVRSADCVVAGYRWYKGGKDKVGSLLLGLYDDAGALHHVGVCGAFKLEKRKELVELLAPLREGAMDAHPWKTWAEWQGPGGDDDAADSEGSTGAESAAPARPQRRPGMGSRWNRGKDLSWVPLRLERVCEVKYDHLQGSRFRHGAHFLRWRDDRSPADCRYDQLEVTPPHELAKIFSPS